MQQQPSSSAIGDAHSQQQRQRLQQREAAEQKASGEDRHAAGRGAASASVSGLSTAQLFHTDGLQCIFAFLQLKELPSTAAVCRDWRDALYKERSRQVTVEPQAMSLLQLLVTSPLRHHVQTLDLLHHDMRSLLDLHALNQLPSLTALSVRFHKSAFVTNRVGGVTSAAAISRMFPRTLSSLYVRVDIGTPVTFIVDIVSHLLQLTELTLIVDERLCESLIESAWMLQRLSLLKKLTLSGWEVDDAVMPLQLRSLAALEELRITGGLFHIWSTKTLRSLTEPTQSKLARLRFIDLSDDTVDAESMQALARLPALEELSPKYFEPDAFPLLASFRALTSLAVRVAGDETLGDETDDETLTPAALIIPHLSGCVQLTSIELHDFSFTDADLQALVAALPHLQKCTFDESEWPSLTALSGASQLRHLLIRQCEVNNDGFDLRPLSVVKSLRVLELYLPQGEVETARILLAIPPFRHISEVKIIRIRGAPF